MKIVGNTVGMGLPKPNLKQTDPRKGDFVKGKDEIPTKVSQLENDSGYLTEHQDISGKLDADKLPEAVNDALAQAKTSGEFDGKDGIDGKDGQDGYTPQKGIDYFDGEDGQDGNPGKDGSNGVSATHSWNGTVLTVTSASGTSSADLKGDKGDKGDSIKGDKGDTGAAGTSVTVKSVSESTADGGSNVVTFSDGKTVTIKNGSKGSPGATPVKGTDYFTEADKAEMVEEVKAGGVLMYTEQVLTKEQQSQTLINLGIGGVVTKETITNNLCDGVYEWGSLEGSGNEGSLTPENYGFRTANFLPVEGGKRVLWNADYTTTGTINQFYCICEYDANKSLVLRTKTISASQNQWDTNKGIVLNANTKYVRFYIYNGANAVDLDNIKINLFYVENIEQFFTGDGDDFVYVPHIIYETTTEFDLFSSPLAGKKIVYDGDSICIGTYGGGGYAKIIADKVGGSFVNQAVGGARLVTKGSGSYHSIVDNLTNLPTDADLYCFDGGVNDVWSSVALGTYEMSNYTGEVDKTTICGALETIFRYCLNNFVGKPICFIITHKVSNISHENYKNYHDSAVAICNKYSIPYYDAYNESGLNGWNTVQNNAFLTGNVNGTPDGCHPNEEGYKRYYVPQLIQLFERIMPTD